MPRLLDDRVVGGGQADVVNRSYAGAQPGWVLVVDNSLRNLVLSPQAGPTGATGAQGAQGAAGGVGPTGPAGSISGEVLLQSLEALVPGSQIRSRIDTEQSLSWDIPQPIQVILSFSFIQYGSVRITLEHFSIVGGRQVAADIVRERNNQTTVLATFVSASTSYESRSADVSVIPGDVVRIQHRNIDATTSFIRNVRIQTNGQDLWPGNGAILEGNRGT
jgi:hypothetical protein